MIRTIDFNSIGETASQFLQQINILKEEQNTLLNDIQKISESYQGKDAESIISQYQEKANSITGYIEFLEEYQKYMDWLSGSYKNSYDKAKRDVSAELEKLAKEEISEYKDYVQNSFSVDILSKLKDGAEDE